MNIKAYLLSLVPHFHKRKLMEHLSETRRELPDAITVYRNACKDNTLRKFKSQYINTFDAKVKAGFSRSTTLKYSGNYMVGVLKGLECMSDNMDTIEAYVDKAFAATDVMRETLTLRRVNLLRYVEAMAHVLKYARRMLLVTIKCETNIPMGLDQFDSISNAELSWLEKNEISFFTNIQAVAISADVFSKVMESVPDVVVTGNTSDVVESTVGAVKSDPFNFNFVPLKYNLFYHWNMARATAQIDRLEDAKDEISAIEFRILNLKKSANGQEPDPALAKSIEYHDRRLAIMREKVSTWEKEYNGK